MSAPETTIQPEGAAPRVALNQIKALIQKARFADALALADRLLETTLEHDDAVEALYMRAVAQRFIKRPELSVATLDALEQRAPDYARGHQERGHAMLDLGDPEGAVRAYGKAVELNPALLASWRALEALHGRAGRDEDRAVAQQHVAYLGGLPPELVSVASFLHEKQLAKAEALCRQFLQKHKDHVEGMRLLAAIATELKIYDDAEFLLESCVEFAPDYARARLDYVGILIKKTKFEKAHEQAKKLMAQDPDNRAFRSSLATTCIGLGEFDAGIAQYKDLLARDPDNARMHLMLGHAQKTAGAVDEAIASYRRAYELKPDFGDAFWSLANIKTYDFTREELRHIKRYEASPEISDEDRIHMCFAAGKAFEDRAEFDASFEYYERGNALKQAQIRYSPDENERRVEAQIATCTHELFERRRGVGHEAPDPIFIVGLPRAGSTLLEQILASHSMVDGTMELHNILQLAQRLRGRMAERTPRYPGILHELEDDYFRRFGEQYIEQTRVYRAGAPLFIDKMPNNFLHIGLIRLILPNAKVIDARRHPMACCFSGFKQLFGEGQEFSYGLEEIGRYYRNYVRLMDHWDEVLPGFVLRVMHEDVVEDLEGQVRRILDFCNLPFEQSCLEYYKTERSVRTPSSEQVKQPIDRSATEQWRNFAKHLTPLTEALGPEVLARYPLDP